jgi:hypothetical protein
MSPAPNPTAPLATRRLIISLETAALLLANDMDCAGGDWPEWRRNGIRRLANAMWRRSAVLRSRYGFTVNETITADR